MLGYRGLRMMTVVTILALICAAPAAAGVEFPDKNLETVIREILKKKQIDKKAIEEADLLPGGSQAGDQEPDRTGTMHQSGPDQPPR